MPMRRISTGLPQVGFNDDPSPLTEGMLHAQSTMAELWPRLSQIEHAKDVEKRGFDERQREFNLREKESERSHQANELWRGEMVKGREQAARDAAQNRADTLKMHGDELGWRKDEKAAADERQRQLDETTAARETGALPAHAKQSFMPRLVDDGVETTANTWPAPSEIGPGTDQDARLWAAANQHGTDQARKDAAEEVAQAKADATLNRGSSMTENELWSHAIAMAKVGQEQADPVQVQKNYEELKAGRLKPPVDPNAPFPTKAAPVEPQGRFPGPITDPRQLPDEDLHRWLSQNDQGYAAASSHPGFNRARALQAYRQGQ
jgi:hypothetical protein